MNTPKKTPQRLPRWTEMSDGQRTEILTALLEGGFGSELKARKIFIQEGFESHAFYYFDKDGGKTREVDILAQRKGSFRHTLDFSQMVIGEVKSGYVWVLGDNVAGEGFDLQGAIEVPPPAWFSAEQKRIPPGRSHQNDKDGGLEFLETAFLGMPLVAGHVATSIHQYRGDGPGVDAWFDAAVKVARACATQRMNLYTDVSQKDGLFFATMVPLIVLDGNLLAAIDSPTGLQLEPREHAQVLYSVGGENPVDDAFVHIVTMEGLPGFLRKITDLEIEATKRIREFYQALTEARKGS